MQLTTIPADRQPEYPPTGPTTPLRYQHTGDPLPQVGEWCEQVLQAALAYEKPYALQAHGAPNLLLHGPTGTGKTHQAWAAVHALRAASLPCSITVTNMPDLLADLLADLHATLEASETFRAAANCGLLVLDDLGANRRLTEWGEETVGRIVSRRYDHMRPTLVTTNIAPDGLEAALGGRIAARLTETATQVVLQGEDRRRRGPE